MKLLLGITNELSQVLQRKDQDIVTTTDFVESSKSRIQYVRDHEWSSLVWNVCTFCEKHNIEVVDLNGSYIVQGRSRRSAQQNTNLNHYQVEIFNTVIDMQLQELNARFTEKNTELLHCMARLSLSRDFALFDKSKLMRLAEFYPSDFRSLDTMLLSSQLDNYIYDMRQNDDFSNLDGIGDLARTLVETKRDKAYHLVYLFITLALTLSVATASVEKTFSVMKLVKTRLRNMMSDAWLNDSLVFFIEKEVLSEIDNESIMRTFQNMNSRRGQLRL